MTCDRYFDVFLKAALYILQELSSRRISFWLLFLNLHFQSQSRILWSSLDQSRCEVLGELHLDLFSLSPTHSLTSIYMYVRKVEISEKAFFRFFFTKTYRNIFVVPVSYNILNFVKSIYIVSRVKYFMVVTYKTIILGFYLLLEKELKIVWQCN